MKAKQLGIQFPYFIVWTMYSNWMAKWVMLETNVTPQLCRYKTKFFVKLANKFYNKLKAICQVVYSTCFLSLKNTHWLQTKRNTQDRMWHTLYLALQDFTWLEHSIQTSPCASSIKGLWLYSLCTTLTLKLHWFLLSAVLWVYQEIKCQCSHFWQPFLCDTWLLT